VGGVDGGNLSGFSLSLCHWESDLDVLGGGFGFHRCAFDTPAGIALLALCVWWRRRRRGGVL